MFFDRGALSLNDSSSTISLTVITWLKIGLNHFIEIIFEVNASQKIPDVSDGDQ
jgi:hypothetical protein